MLVSNSVCLFSSIICTTAYGMSLYSGRNIAIQTMDTNIQIMITVPFLQPLYSAATHSWEFCRSQQNSSISEECWYTSLHTCVRCILKYQNSYGFVCTPLSSLLLSWSPATKQPQTLVSLFSCWAEIGYL